ncbi:hypothetical protein H8N03_16215 [Ramlibacter sp. USB13]|uniref:Uncharacterized protein n=1 Tax=Ramlibacter cellulosilyticus TaxID=2764187 RepID=A0A923SC37_9BURK|nr:hypothetical protein [Ramlibacter cellulosilyticus]MBC5784494.1 hypothetical protein [Ramlibacter cellulosilyticus]
MATKPTPGNEQNAWTLLVDAIARLPAAERAEAIRDLQLALGATDSGTAEQLLNLLGKGPAAARIPSGPAPPGYVLMLAALLGRAIERHPALELPESGLKALPTTLSRLPFASLRPLVGPALRVVIGRPTDADVHLLVQFLKEISMSATFFVDPSSIPLFQDPNTRDTLVKALTDKVTSELQVTFGVSAAQADVKTVPSAAAVLGMVLLDGEADANSGSLRTALQRAWLESIGEMPAVGAPNATVPLSEVYKFIADTLPKFKGGSTSISHQEFAFVARSIIGNGASIKFGHPDLESSIRIALDQYVQSRATGDSLSLPPGTLPGGTQNAGGDADLNSDNIRVIGLVYPLALLEKALPLRVADRVAELFMNGLLPFGQGAAGKAIDDYYWESEDRLNEAQRRSQYARMIGMPGGEVSKEVAPNKNFEQLFLRFISAVSEFTRQREVDRMFTTRTSILATTDEQVRKCAFEVAQNASLYAWGGSFHVAARINRHLQRAIEILNQPPVLRVYAASNHWQVIERVAQQDFGGAPNWAKYSTMAQAASRIFDVLARNTPALSASATGVPFLFDPALAGSVSSGFAITTTSTRPPSGLSPADTNQILTSVQLWLAVNGVRDDQVKQYAQPVEMNTVPSIPTLPGTSTSGDTSGMDVLNKLKQLTASGTPNPDQVQQLLSSLH